MFNSLKLHSMYFYEEEKVCIEHECIFFIRLFTAFSLHALNLTMIKNLYEPFNIYIFFKHTHAAAGKRVNVFFKIYIRQKN